MSSMRTGADYRESLRDGRRVWILGEGLSRRRHDPSRHAADGRANMSPGTTGTSIRNGRTPCSCRRTKAACAGRSAISCRGARTISRRMGRCFSATTFLSAGNITHTPAYGHLIALGVLHAVGLRQSLAGAGRQRRGLSRGDRPHRPLPDLRRGRRDDRLSAARGSRRAGRRSGSSGSPTQAS